MTVMEFTCLFCGCIHDISQISFGAEAPIQWALLTDAERAESELGRERCIVESSEGRHFFVRACLEIPIKATDQIFTWGVWTSLSEVSFMEMDHHWDDPERIRLGPYFGWLCSKIPEYPDSAFLKSRVHQRSVGVRPLVELEPTDHPLALHQREGVDLERLQEIVVKVLHSEA